MSRVVNTFDFTDIIVMGDLVRGLSDQELKATVLGEVKQETEVAEVDNPFLTAALPRPTMPVQMRFLPLKNDGTGVPEGLTFTEMREEILNPSKPEPERPMMMPGGPNMMGKGNSPWLLVPPLTPY